MPTFRALRAFPHGNSHVAAGAIVNLTVRQAAFLEPGGYIERVAPLETAPHIQDIELPQDADTVEASSQDDATDAVQGTEPREHSKKGRKK